VQLLLRLIHIPLLRIFKSWHLDKCSDILTHYLAEIVKLSPQEEAKKKFQENVMKGMVRIKHPLKLVQNLNVKFINMICEYCFIAYDELYRVDNKIIASYIFDSIGCSLLLNSNVWQLVLQIITNS